MIPLTAATWIWLVGLVVAGLAGLPVRRHHFEAAGLAFGVSLTIALLRNWSPVAPRPKARAWKAALLCALIAVLAFAWSLTLGPLSDDFGLRTVARAGTLVPADWVHLRPVPLLLWVIVERLGAGWWGFHALNVALHALNTALVVVLGARFFRLPTAFLGGLAFALLPTNVEAVAWSAGVFDLTMTTFVLMAVIAWLTVSSRSHRLAGVVLCVVVALLSKETAVGVLPLLVLLTFVAGDRSRRDTWISVAAIAVIVVAYVALRASVSSDVAAQLVRLPHDNRAWKDLVLRPFAALFVPLRTETGVGFDVYAAALAWLSMAAMVLLGLRRTSHDAEDRVEYGQARNAAAFGVIGIGWAAAFVLPLMSDFYVGPDLDGGRYLYAPSAGLALLLMGLIEVGGRWQAKLTLVAACLVVGISAVALYQEQQVWRAAAATRDRLFDRVLDPALANCGRVEVINAPDSVRGVEVFRVGLKEAVSEVRPQRPGPVCRLEWR